MSLIVIGINHNTTSLDIRGKLSFDYKKEYTLSSVLYNESLADSVLILSTCNRSEVYIHKDNVDDNHSWISRIEEIILSIHQLSLSHNEFKKIAYILHNVNAVAHMMKVACGLDSLIIGEPQILGQLKIAYNRSIELCRLIRNTNLDTYFDRLVQDTFSCSKKVRTYTDIAKTAKSISYVACTLVKKDFFYDNRKKILLIGAGSTIELVCKHISSHLNDARITVINRTIDKAKRLASNFLYGKYDSLSNLDLYTQDTDLIITCTGSLDPIISFSNLKDIQNKRCNKKLVIVDLAVPADIECISDINGLTLYNIDYIQRIIEENNHRQNISTHSALKIVKEFTKKYQSWRRAYKGGDLIKIYRNSIEEVRNNIVDYYSNKINNGLDPIIALEKMSILLSNKIMHTPTSLISEFIRVGDNCGLNSFADSLKRDDYKVKQAIYELKSKDVFKVSSNTCCRYRKEEIEIDLNNEISSCNYIKL